MSTQHTHAVFPIPVESLELSKRELFAAMAMQGILSDPNVTNLEDAVSSAVNAADALITALNSTR